MAQRYIRRIRLCRHADLVVVLFSQKLFSKKRTKKLYAFSLRHNYRVFYHGDVGIDDNNFFLPCGADVFSEHRDVILFR